MAPKKRALPSPLPDGWILRDTEKREWRLGRIIGSGGFGLIYLASDCVDTPVREDTDYVIKVEYHENGPLFSELKFYQRVAKPDSIRKWKRNKGIDFLGIPTYWGSGLSEHNGTRYRFMVMDRLGSDLQKIFVQNGERLKKGTVLQLGCLMVDVLEYIHSNEYVHADIKAANLLLGHRDPDKVYLADYGLSYRYFPNGMHKEYKENPKKGHNGTIEYTSIDAHKGVAPSRRGDLEVLGYCLLHWQCGTLPWLSMLRNPAQVQDAKAKLMDSLPDSVIQLSTDRSTLEVAQFLLSIRTLDYEEQPDYEALRKVLSVTMHQGPLDFSRPSAAESARLATNRYPNQARSAGKPARPVLVNEDEAESFAKTRYRTRGPSKTKQQKTYKDNSTADRYATSRPLFLECGDDDEVDALPQRAHTKAKEVPKQRKRSDQQSLAHGLRRTGTARLPVRKQQQPLGLHHSFVPDTSDHWRRNCHSWGDTRRASEEEEDYWEHPMDNHWEDMDYNGHQYGADVYNEDQYTHTNRNGAVESSNKPFLQCFLKICAGIIIILMLRMVYIH